MRVCAHVCIHMCTCVCLSSTAEEELGWGLGFQHPPPVYSVHDLQGWGWYRGLGGAAEFILPPGCRNRASLPLVSPVEPPPLTFHCSLSPDCVCLPHWLELLGGRVPWLVFPESPVSPERCAHWGLWPEGLTDSEGLPTAASPGRSSYICRVHRRREAGRYGDSVRGLGHVPGFTSWPSGQVFHPGLCFLARNGGGISSRLLGLRIM